MIDEKHHSKVFVAIIILVIIAVVLVILFTAPKGTLIGEAFQFLK